MNQELMMNIAKRTLEDMDMSKVKRVDLNSLEYPDGSPAYTITIVMQIPEPTIPEAVEPIIEMPIDEPTEAADEPVIPEAADEANGEQ